MELYLNQANQYTLSVISITLHSISLNPTHLSTYGQMERIQGQSKKEAYTDVCGLKHRYHY